MNIPLLCVLETRWPRWPVLIVRNKVAINTLVIPENRLEDPLFQAARAEVEGIGTRPYINTGYGQQLGQPL
jgi:hypothetical protein